MPIFSFLGLPRSALTIGGPDPFADLHNRNPAVGGATTMTVESGGWQELAVNDDETMFHDGDMNQVLAAGITFNGIFYPAGTQIENEYTYVIRPDGSSDPADDITLVAIKIGGSMVGFATEARLLPGITYRFRSGGSDGPTSDYAALVVCFTPGTLIACPGGARPVETLTEGDLVQTLDNGPQPLVWVGRQVSRGRGRRAPVRIAAGRLGNARDLYLSPQHRVLIRPDQGLHLPGQNEVLVPIKALLDQTGVRVVPHLQIVYHHLLFAQHQVVLAEGLGTESFFPGPEAIRALDRAARARLFLRFPELRRGAIWDTARPLLSPGAFQRLWLGQGGVTLSA